MASDSGKYQIPVGPSTLCFNKDEFLKDTFSLDRFIAECRNHVPLETLRDDLSIYMRLLQAAMIELINQDYADFVNLSGNLVGFDKALIKLSSPLEHLKEEVVKVKSLLDEIIDQIECKLRQIKRLREQKTCLQLLMASVQCVEHIENQMKIQTCSGNSSDIVLDGNIMERISFEFNRLHFVMKSNDLPFINVLKPKVSCITNVLQRNLEEAFLQSIHSNDLNCMKQCLRIYASINKSKDAEDLFRKKVISPRLENIISDSVWKNHPQGLSGMYAKVLEAIPKLCSDLRTLTDPTLGDSVGGFDFVVNAFWPEVVSGIEVRTPLLCDLTNPRLFHERYLTSMEFLDKFEDECSSLDSVTRFRRHGSFSAFLGKWNLAVYFQIRFQEIAGTLETSLLRGLSNVVQPDEHGFVLPQTQTLWQCLVTCWSVRVYLRALVHRFWKLSMLLCSRYATWVFEVLFGKISGRQLANNSDVLLPAPHFGDSPVNGLPSSSVRDNFVASIVALVADIHLLQLKLPLFVREVIIPHLECFINSDRQEIINESVNEACKCYEDLLPKMDKMVTDEITSQSLCSLRLVNDIPRLFRKTNREVPSKPSAYVTSSIKCLGSFVGECGSLLQPQLKRSWTRTIVANLTQQYLLLTSDVLTSVKKMEDSLKRLKMARDKNLSINSGVIAAGMSDDDKIRLQLALDVEYFGEQIKELGIDGTDLPSFQQLLELVESARSSPVASTT